MDILQDPIKEIPQAEQSSASFQGQENASNETPEQAQEQQERKSELFYQKILSQVQSDQSSNASDDGVTTELDAKAIASLEDMDTQVARLVELAGVKGPQYAVGVARKLDFYVLDQVHDQLANHFYDRLVEQGLIAKE
jgi:hypothetical protein